MPAPPENYPTLPINLRLHFDSGAEAEIGAWEERLRAGGVTVLSRSAQGLDIEAPQEILQEMLAVEISIGSEGPQVVDLPQEEVSPAKPRPHIYAPRRPTFFKKE